MGRFYVALQEVFDEKLPVSGINIKTQKESTDQLYCE